MKRSFNSDKIFDAVNVIIVIFLFFVFIWPLWFVLIASVSDPNLVYLGKVLLWPRGVYAGRIRKDTGLQGDLDGI